MTKVSRDRPAIGREVPPESPESTTVGAVRPSSLALLSLALSAALTVSVDVRAADPDPWLGEDKLLHFSASATAAGLGYGVSSLFVAPRWQRATIGATGALFLGVGKEAYDATGHGVPSWRDLTWDVIGTAVGTGLAFSIDLLLGSARSSSATTGRGLVVTF
jgi:putative lipoprotein